MTGRGSAEWRRESTSAGEPRPELVRQVRDRYPPGSGPLLGFVGRVIKEKGVEDIVPCHRPGYRPTDPDVSAFIAGTGQHTDRVPGARLRPGGDRTSSPPGLDRLRPCAVLGSPPPTWLSLPAASGPDGWVEKPRGSRSSRPWPLAGQWSPQTRGGFSGRSPTGRRGCLYLPRIRTHWPRPSGSWWTLPTGQPTLPGGELSRCAPGSTAR